MYTIHTIYTIYFLSFPLSYISSDMHTVLTLVLFVCFSFLAALHTLWNLSSPNREWTRATTVNALSLNHWAAGGFLTLTLFHTLQYILWITSCQYIEIYLIPFYICMVLYVGVHSLYYHYHSLTNSKYCFQSFGIRNIPGVSSHIHTSFLIFASMSL